MRFDELTADKQKIKTIKSFADWAMNKLGISDPPRIKYSDDKNQVTMNRTFGATNADGEIWVYLGDRNTADCARTLCHELVHHRQFELGQASETMDSEQRQKIEDQANAIAGRMMREYGLKHVEIYESVYTSKDQAIKKLITKSLSDIKTQGASIIKVRE